MAGFTTQRMEVWRLVQQIAEMAEKRFLEDGDRAGSRDCFVGYLHGLKGDAEESEPFARHLSVAFALIDIGMPPLKVADEMRRMGI